MSFRTTISYVLWPLTMWYGIGVAVRNFLYAVGIKRQEAPHITTIGVGNLSTGGSGKTPMVEYLLRLLADSYATAMLSRGYKRKSKGYQEDDGSHDAALLGDEAAMVARKFPQVQVAVCEKRVEGVRRLMEQERVEQQADGGEVHVSTAPQVVVLDDVFQHRAIKPSLNILLTEYGNPFFKDRILPYGNLREFKSARYRASIVIVTKSPARLNPVEKHNIIRDLRLQNYQKVFFSYIKYLPLRTLDGKDAGIDLRKTDSVLLVSGIANPKPIVDELKRSCKLRQLVFPDHHAYTRKDVDRIKETFEAMADMRKVIVTTEKDAVRLVGLTGELPVYVLPIEVAIHEESGIDFDQAILSTVKENVLFLSKLSIWS